jgi:hypothetical protein
MTFSALRTVRHAGMNSHLAVVKQKTVPALPGKPVAVEG